MAKTWLTRDEVKDIVRTALKQVGSPSGDIEKYTFEGWDSHHKRVFVIAVTDGMLKTGHDIFLTEGKLDRFANIGEFIDYVTDEQALRRDKLGPAF